MKYNFKYLLLANVFALFAFQEAFAQCPVTSFTIPANACKNENLSIQNTTTGATSYSWDFCEGDLASTPTAKLILTNAGLAVSHDLKLFYEQNKWYGFLVGYSNKKLFRLDFGDSLKYTPTITDLGALGGSPTGIDLVKENSTWYGLVTNSDPSYKLTRLNFGSSITSVPTITDLGNVGGLLTAPYDIVVKYDNSEYVAFAVNYNTSFITRIKFGSSMLNTPSADNIAMTAGGATGLSFYKACNQWYAMSTMYSGGGVHKLSFGTSLNNAPTVVKLTPTGFSAMSTPTNLKIVVDAGVHYCFVQSKNGDFYRFDFGADLSTNSPAGVNLGKLGVFTNSSFPFMMAKEGSKWIGFTISQNTNQLFKIDFPDNCSSNSPTSTNTTPTNVKYSASGTYKATLTSTSATNTSNSVTKTVTVSSTDAPAISFSVSKECFSAPVDLTATVTNGQTITSWNWDFGDPGSGVNNTSTSQNTSHQFSAKGTYTVKLQVQSTNGCNNYLTKDVTVYDETTPDFPVPAGTICSSASITFTNSSTKETGSHVKWLWDFGDGKTDTAKVPSHIYAEGGTYNVTLTAGVLGCSNSIMKPVTIIQGPKTGFKYQNICFGETTIFTDTTIGTSLTDWDWNFGDGNTSTLQSPVNTYATTGAFNVTLKVKNSNGCEISKTRQIKINALPVVDFLLPTVICNGDSLEFNDLSTLSDGNLINWKWEMFNEQGLSLDKKQGKKKVHFFFPVPGKYSITETVISEAGCSQLITKNLDVLKAPEIDINVTNICLGDSASLEGVSKIAGQSISAWSWEISDGGLHVGKNPKHKFTAAGKYTIYLTAVSSNNCPSTVSKEVTIYEKPVANFSSSNNCLNAPVQFTDLSTIVNGTIISWTWNFGGLGTSSDKNPQFTFNKAGSVAVALTVTSSQGCTFKVTKNIVIQALPVANFSFEPEVGPPPFEVQFNNASTGASTYKWNFGDGGASTLKSPVYTYDSLGVYSVNVIAFNAYGCSDTLSKTIRVMPPVLTTNLDKILVSTLTEELAFAIEVKNTGSKIIKNIEFVIDFGGTLSFRETWSGVLNPEEKMTYPLRTQLIKTQLSRVKYLCIGTTKLNNESFSGEGNKICEDLVEQFLVFGPNPNPAKNSVTFSYTLPLLPEKNAFEINFYNTQGQKIIFTPQNYKQGFNESVLNTSFLKPGLYTIEFVYNRERTLRRVLIY